MKQALISHQVFVPSPAPGVAAHGASYYTCRTGFELLSIHSHLSRSDTLDVSYHRHSTDNGRTWSKPTEHATREVRPTGTLRRHPRAGYVDPNVDRFVRVWTEGILPTDKPAEGMKHWVLYYSVSEDGGRTVTVSEPVVHKGQEFDADHPLPGVWKGRSSVMMGDLTCVPLGLKDGTILVPCQITPLGPDGSYFNPTGALTYHDSAVLRGRWRADQHLEWEISERVIADPARSTRGVIEPTLGLLADGRILMVMRGSNEMKPDELPGYRWFSISADDGWTWTQPQPWTDTAGQLFYSPSSCSQLFAHSSGTLYWLGNLTPTNPRGNLPRYPLVIGEVDRDTGQLIRETVRTIDDRAPGETEKIFLSNFHAREDRATGEIVLHMTRLFARDVRDFTADALLYRIAP